MERKRQLIGAILCPAVWMALLAVCVPFVYAIVDDRTMMEIVSGQYLGEPDAHMIFTGYWYSALVAGAYRLMRNVDWYAAFYLLLQAVCAGLMAFRLLRRKSAAGSVFAAALLVLWCIALGIRPATQLSFTTTAAVLAVTVIFWYMTADAVRIRDLLTLTVLGFLTIELRFSVFCMILPVCAVLWAFRVWEEKGRNRLSLLVPLAPAAAALLYAAGLFLGYGSPEWTAYNAYNNTRSLIYDYEDYMFPRYEDEQELYHSVGIYAKARAKNLYYYNYTADDGITQEFFDRYFQARSAQAKERTDVAQRLTDTVKSYGKGVLSGKYGYGHLLAMLGYGGLFLVFAWRKQWRECLKTVCVPGVQLLLWLYLIYRGRMPERVLVSMNLMLIVPLLLLWREALAELAPRFPIQLRRCGAAFLLAALCAAAAGQIASVRTKNLDTAKWNRNVEALKIYCMERPENFYFNDVTSMAMTTYNVRLWQGTPYTMNYMSLGDWIAFSPLWEEKLSQNGIASVRDALYGQDNVYLISSFDRGTEYLTELYGGVTCTEVDKVAGFRIYKLERL
ncbi:MAG: hypothetical protein Q4C82_03075 [Eubacteriales bacterium]|nr:hypothetical protein [Eubacteriales bacterium]